MRALRHTLEYSALWSYSIFARALPRRVALALSTIVGEVGWRTRLRRRVVMENLDRVFPDRSRADKLALARKSCHNFARAATEFARFGSDRADVGELVTVEGLDQLKQAAQSGPGALIVTGHLGAWALYVTALAAKGQPTSLLVGKQSNQRVDNFIHAIPGDAVELIGKGPLAPRGVLRGLAQGRCVLMVADQHSRVGVEAPFLGHLCKTLALPGAILAKRPRPLFLLEGYHVGRGRHRVELVPFQLPEFDEETTEQRTIAIAALCNRAIGEAVLRHPDQYFWHHRRWRRNRAPQAEDGTL